jgi:hypothetical protein
MDSNIKQTEITMENTNDFDIMVINKGAILTDIINNYNDPNYVRKIIKLGLCKIITVNKDTILQAFADHLETERYTDNDYINNEVIGEEPYYIYELLYVDLEKNKNHRDKNDFASLININGDVIYSNAIIMKTHLPSLSESMYCESITLDDLERIIHKRVFHKIVCYRNYEYVEDNTNNLDDYAKTFFEGEYYRKIELAFLSHNINIWYVSELGEKDVCGKLIDGTVEKCIWFTMQTDDYKGNLSLDEVKKIIYLSNKLDNYNPSKWLDQKCDKFGRMVIKNKYRVLDQAYHDNL